MKDFVEVMTPILVFLGMFGIYDLVCVLWIKDYTFVLGTQVLALALLLPTVLILAKDVEPVEIDELVNRLNDTP